MAERVFGPVLSARIATLIEPERARQMAAKLPTAFVADIACELDPRRAHEVIARIPPDQVADVTRELIARDEYVTMGRFVGHLDAAAIKAAVAAMDPGALLQVGFVLENKESFRDVFDLLSDERLREVIESASREQLWPEVLDLLTNLADDQRERAIEIAAGCDDGVLDTLIRAADAESLWELVLPLTGLMTEASLKRFVSLRSLQRKGVLEHIVDAAADHEELWDNLVPMVSQLPPRCQSRVAVRAQALGSLERLGELGHGELGRALSA
jgi:Mg/Co/Ni transporter MgtE